MQNFTAEALMYTYSWYQWLTFFYIYCFFGWIFESTYVSFKKRHFVNRGFLRLPMLPLYGTGAVMMLWISLPVRNNLILVYFSGVMAATALEYVTGYVMEQLFKIKYWDYSDQRFQINGYICLTSSIAWGFLTIFLTEIIHKPIADFVLNMNLGIQAILLSIVTITFIIDTIQSTKEAFALGRALETMTAMKTELEEMQQQLLLLKSEASRRMEDIKSDAIQKADEFRTEALLRIEELGTGALQRTENAQLRIEELSAEALERAEDIREKARIQADNVKASIRLQAKEMKMDTVLLASELKENVSQLENRSSKLLSDLKQASSQKAAQLQEEAATHILRQADSLSQLSEQIHLLSERRKHILESRRGLSSRMSFYRKSILKGNPTASCKKFAEALKELRDMLEHE